MSKKYKKYTEEFKKQIVEIVNTGKSISSVATEYGISKSTVRKWTLDYNNSGSFESKYNRTDEENEMIKLKKELTQLRMENDILKQAALIMGRK